MIKFFRKIRQKLLSENKFSKYLIYAIGEIVLVVIGILIALALNNWNEGKKIENQIVGIISQFENDILDNFDDATRALKFYANQENICEDVLFDNLNIGDYKNNDLISIVTGNWDIVTPKSENLDYLLDNQKATPENYRPIIDAAKILKDREGIMNSNWNRLNANIQENIEKLTNEVSMIRLDSISKQDRFEYMLTNKDYKKIVELYWINASDYSDKVSRYRAQLMATLSTIKVVKENYGVEDLKAFYKSNDMFPFIQVECKDEQIKSDYKIRRRSYLLGNLSHIDVTLKVENNNKITGIYTIKPNSFGYSRPEYAGIGGDYRTVVEQLNNDDNCLRKFVSVENGYLIIE